MAAKQVRAAYGLIGSSVVGIVLAPYTVVPLVLMALAVVILGVVHLRDEHAATEAAPEITIQATGPEDALRWALYQPTLPPPSVFNALTTEELYWRAKALDVDVRRCVLESQLDLMGVPDADQVVQAYLGRYLD